jgi:hypothetical protein
VGVPALKLGAGRTVLFEPIASSPPGSFMG